MVQLYLQFRNVMMVVAVVLCLNSFCLADDSTTAKESSALGIRQQRVKRMMQELDRRFQDLAEKLQAKEPEQAKLLIKAYQQSREKLIEQRMEEISLLLDSSNFSEADKKQGLVHQELDSLLRVLLDQGKNWDEVNAEIEQLEATRLAVQELLAEQREHLRETDRLANPDKTLADLDAKIKEIDELLEAQKELSQQTEQAKPDEQPVLEKLATQQEQLQQQTEKLTKAMGKQDSEPKPNASKQDTAPESSENKKPNSSAEEPGASGTEKCKACLGSASQSQKSASQKLAQSLPKDAQKDEQKSIEDLKKAADALKEERDRIARLPKEMLDQIAQKQEATSEDAKKLLDEMEKMQSESESKSKEAPKGKKNVDQAQKSMKQAADGLRQSDAMEASKEQEKAVNELKEALDQIEKRLAQLREETLIDRLARLEARFRSMLARQEEVTRSTVATHKKQLDAGKLTRADSLGLRKLSAEERDLAEEANQTNELLIEDGTSVVFPRVVANLQGDLMRLGDLLDESKVDMYTQALQQDVAVTLQELIDALQRNLKKKKGNEGSGECNCEPPLVPGSAELKMLRSMQLRVHHRTELLNKALETGELDASMKKEVSALTEMQKKVAEMALEMAEKY